MRDDDDDDDDSFGRLDRRRPSSGTQANLSGATTLAFSLARFPLVLATEESSSIPDGEDASHTTGVIRQYRRCCGYRVRAARELEKRALECFSLSLSLSPISLARFSPAQRPIRSLTLAEVGRDDASANHAPASQKREKVIRKKE